MRGQSTAGGSARRSSAGKIVVDARVWQTQIALVERGTQSGGRTVSFRQAASIEDPAVLFRLFELVARHNVR